MRPAGSAARAPGSSTHPRCRRHAGSRARRDRRSGLAPLRGGRPAFAVALSRAHRGRPRPRSQRRSCRCSTPVVGWLLDTGRRAAPTLGARLAVIRGLGRRRDLGRSPRSDRPRRVQAVSRRRAPFAWPQLPECYLPDSRSRQGSSRGLPAPVGPPPEAAAASREHARRSPDLLARPRSNGKPALRPMLSGDAHASYSGINTLATAGRPRQRPTGPRRRPRPRPRPAATRAADACPGRGPCSARAGAPVGPRSVSPPPGARRRPPRDAQRGGRAAPRRPPAGSGRPGIAAELRRPPGRAGELPGLRPCAG